MLASNPRNNSATRLRWITRRIATGVRLSWSPESDVDVNVVRKSRDTVRSVALSKVVRCLYAGINRRRT